MVMHLKSCCCGCTLKTGSVIIAVLTAIGALIGLIAAIIAASAGTGTLQKEVIQQLEIQKGTPLTQEEYNSLNKGLSNNNLKISTTDTVVFICSAIVNALHLIFSIMLIFGASAERPRLVKPWIIFSLLSLIVQSILQFVRIITIFSAGLVLVGVLGLVIVGVIITIGVYFLLVVNSFHTELISNNFPNKI